MGMEARLMVQDIPHSVLPTGTGPSSAERNRRTNAKPALVGCTELLKREVWQSGHLESRKHHLK